MFGTFGVPVAVVAFGETPSERMRPTDASARRR